MRPIVWTVNQEKAKKAANSGMPPLQRSQVWPLSIHA